VACRVLAINGAPRPYGLIFRHKYTIFNKKSKKNEQKMPDNHNLFHIFATDKGVFGNQQS